MRTELRFSPLAGLGKHFASKTFLLDQPTSIELDGAYRGNPSPAPDNFIFPSFALAIDQAQLHYTGSGLTLSALSDLSDNVYLNGEPLGEDAQDLKDGDVVWFGTHHLRDGAFRIECAALVSIYPSLPPPPHGTNWEGIQALVSFVRRTASRHPKLRPTLPISSPAPTSVPTLVLPSSTAPTASSSNTESSQSPSLSSSPVVSPLKATPTSLSASDEEFIIRELRAMRLEMERAHPLPSDSSRLQTKVSSSKSAPSPSSRPCAPTLSTFPVFLYGAFVTAHALRSKPDNPSRCPEAPLGSPSANASSSSSRTSSGTAHSGSSLPAFSSTRVTANAHLFPTGSHARGSAQRSAVDSAKLALSRIRSAMTVASSFGSAPARVEVRCTSLPRPPLSCCNGVESGFRCAVPPFSPVEDRAAVDLRQRVTPSPSSFDLGLARLRHVMQQLGGLVSTPSRAIPRAATAKVDSCTSCGDRPSCGTVIPFFIKVCCHCPRQLSSGLVGACPSGSRCAGLTRPMTY
ncbi:hypothetical protein CF326_g9053 [Tilletia indica]|nr:hypothetical protein CF326_g9053 [Tilletia indica]